MTDEQRPAEQTAKCGNCGSEYPIDCIHSCQVVRPNSDAPLSEIVRQPATKREETLIGSLRVYWLHGYRIELQGIHGEIFGKWILSRPGYSTFKPLAFDYAADALAHAEQLAEGGE